jgi:hypothetical protein
VQVYEGAGAKQNVIQNVDFTESFKRERDRRLLNARKKDEEV